MKDVFVADRHVIIIIKRHPILYIQGVSDVNDKIIYKFHNFYEYTKSIVLPKIMNTRF